MKVKQCSTRAASKAGTKRRSKRITAIKYGVPKSKLPNKITRQSLRKRRESTIAADVSAVSYQNPENFLEQSGNSDCAEHQRAHRKRCKYSADSLDAAICSVIGGTSVRGSALSYGIPISTLQDKISGKYRVGRAVGRDPVLSDEEELLIVKWVKDCTKYHGLCPQRMDVQNTVQIMMRDIQKPNPFTNDRPGTNWLLAFTKRHDGLPIRTRKDDARSRVLVNESFIRKWFLEMKMNIESLGSENILQKPSRMFSLHENCMQLCTSTGKVSGFTGWKLLDGEGPEKMTFSYLVTFSASGRIVPPMIIYPFNEIPTDIKDYVPTEFKMGTSELGQISADNLLEYISDCFNPWLEDNAIEKPVVLYVDGRKAQLSYQLFEMCERLKIIFYLLPPHTSDIFQPTEVGPCKRIKSHWKTVLEKHQTCVNSKVERTDVAILLDQVLQKISPVSIIYGFRNSGIFPHNVNAIDFHKCPDLSSMKIEIADFEHEFMDSCFTSDEKETSNIDENFNELDHGASLCINFKPESPYNDVQNMNIESQNSDKKLKHSLSKLPKTVNEFSFIENKSHFLATISASLPTISASLPTISPSMPTISPSMPMASPSMPMASPTMPKASPTMPKASPTMPTASSTMPTASSTMHTASPSMPTASSTMPTASPSMPTASPSMPTASPSMPTASPSLPMASPSMPTVSPSLPVASPSMPTVSPSIPTVSPSMPTVSLPMPTSPSVPNMAATEPPISLSEYQTALRVVESILGSEMLNNFNTNFNVSDDLFRLHQKLFEKARPNASSELDEDVKIMRTSFESEESYSSSNVESPLGSVNSFENFYFRNAE